MAHFIREEMKARGWDEEELAKRLDVGIGTVELYLGSMRLGVWEADKLAKVFGNHRQQWLNLDAAFWSALESELYHLIKNEPEVAS